MKLTERDIKDKRIEVAGIAYVATIYMTNGGVLNCGRHLTLKSAQKALEEYPKDVFEGNDDPSVQKELDRFGRGKEKKEDWEPSRTRKHHDYTRLYDRRC